MCFFSVLKNHVKKTHKMFECLETVLIIGWKMLMHICAATVGSNVEAHVTACETCERSRLKISLLHSKDFDLQLHKQSHCQGNAIVLGAKPAREG